MVAIAQDAGNIPKFLLVDANGKLILGASTLAIGKLAANDGVDIGDVDVKSIAAGDNNIGNVDIVSLPSIPAGTNNIGDVDILSIAAGDNNIGNVDVVSLPSLPAGTNNIGDVDIASIAAGDNNIGNVDVVTLPSLVAGTAIIGAVKTDKVNYTPVHKDAQATTAQTDTTLWDPTPGTKFVITDITISVDTAMTVHLEDGTTKIYEFYFAANGGCVINLQTPYPSTTADNNLTYTTNTAGKISIAVDGYEE